MKTVRVHGACLAGINAELIRVEARYDHYDRQRTEVTITGLPDAVIRESRGRLVSALATAGLVLPHGRLLLNLVPAARRKTGEMLDLAMAVAACAAGGYLEARPLRKVLLLGEVGLDGQLHPVPGGIAAALAATAAGLDELIAPLATAREAAWIEGVAAFAATDLEQVAAHLSGAQRLKRLPTEPDNHRCAPPAGLSLDDVRGQATGKLALAVAGVGGHGLLFIGPPGTGKSMLARRASLLAPPTTLQEQLEITQVLSAGSGSAVAGSSGDGLIRTRPFRAPHHSASFAALVGGGAPPGPGEVTLAHGGVLFLDELPEFRRDALEALRTPLEEGVVRIGRASARLSFPARFRLVAAMNPCPCGYLGHPRTPCRCSPTAVQRYRGRISGPLLDRIDLRVELPAPSLDELATRSTRSSPSERDPNATSGEEWLERVAAAAERQHGRQGPRLNASLEAGELDQHAPLSEPGRRLLGRAVKARALSARAVQSLRRVARSLADLDGAEHVETAHLARALALRAPLLRGIHESPPPARPKRPDATSSTLPRR